MFPSLWTQESDSLEDRFVIKQGISSITQAEAYALIEGGHCVLVDVREPDEYHNLHISGAINLPVDEINRDTAARVLPDRDLPIVLYCLAGMRAASAAIKLSELGYRRIMNMGGISHWPYATEQS